MEKEKRAKNPSQTARNKKGRKIHWQINKCKRMQDFWLPPCICEKGRKTPVIFIKKDKETLKRQKNHVLMQLYLTDRHYSLRMCGPVRRIF